MLYKYKHIFFLKTGKLILNWIHPMFLLQSSHTWETILTFYLCHFFSELRTIWKASKNYAQKTLKKPNLNLRMNWENLGPNLSFTLANKASNLHKIKLLLFQTQWMRFSITSNYNNLSGKAIFSIEKNENFNLF